MISYSSHLYESSIITIGLKVQSRRRAVIYSTLFNSSEKQYISYLLSLFNPNKIFFKNNLLKKFCKSRNFYPINNIQKWYDDFYDFLRYDNNHTISGFCHHSDRGNIFKENASYNILYFSIFLWIDNNHYNILIIIKTKIIQLNWYYYFSKWSLS